MTNPNNAIGTNAAYSGRTSVDAFNDVMGAFNGRGVLSGWACTPGTGMAVQLGGDGSTRDVAIAEDNAGNRVSINNVSGLPVEVAIDAAPATGNRIDLIVAYAENPPTGVSTVVDNPQACGIIDVVGTAAANPTAPDEAAIRNAITIDGATGATAYYVVLAQVRVGTNVTSIGSGVITQGGRAGLGANTVGTDALQDGSITSDKIDFFASVSNSAADYVTFSNTTQQAKISVTIPVAGKYFCVASANFGSEAATLHETYISVMQNGTAVPYSGRAFYGNQQGQISGLMSLATFAIVDCAAGDTISCGARVDKASSQIGSRLITAFRIG